ncbi:MAG TPA: toxin-antitoxin system HicB family antitoxin [Vicinamibacteria bacterium]|nr:toxin-antitoxin system HicB family antitoxin [Vicinamibacteria bacterium]
MSTLSLRLPDSLHEKIRELAAREDISINQFIAIAVAEKMSALLTLDYLAERAGRGSRAAFERVLDKVPARTPLSGDEWPAAESVKPRRRSPTKKAKK